MKNNGLSLLETYDLLFEILNVIRIPLLSLLSSSILAFLSPSTCFTPVPPSAQLPRSRCPRGPDSPLGPSRPHGPGILGPGFQVRPRSPWSPSFPGRPGPVDSVDHLLLLPGGPGTPCRPCGPIVPGTPC